MGGRLSLQRAGGHSKRGLSGGCGNCEPRPRHGHDSNARPAECAHGADTAGEARPESSAVPSLGPRDGRELLAVRTLFYQRAVMFPAPGRPIPLRVSSPFSGLFSTRTPSNPCDSARTSRPPRTGSATPRSPSRAGSPGTESRTGGLGSAGPRGQVTLVRSLFSRGASRQVLTAGDKLPRARRSLWFPLIFIL